MIQRTGFFRNKAKAIREASGDIVAKFGGKVPATMEELTSCRGWGGRRRMWCLGNAFGKNVGVVVDTHVGRLAGRLGWSEETVPEKIEAELMQLVPQGEVDDGGALLIFHGRAVCAGAEAEVWAVPAVGGVLPGGGQVCWQGARAGVGRLTCDVVGRGSSIVYRVPAPVGWPR